MPGSNNPKKSETGKPTGAKTRKASPKKTGSEGLAARREPLLQGGGAKRIEKQHAAGKLTARERLESLLDPKTFTETGLHAAHRCTEFEMAGKAAAADGVVTGHGMISGRPVCVFAQDFTVIGGSLGLVHASKICSVLDTAMKSGWPVVGLNDSAGARVQEGVDALSGYGQIFYRNSIASGVVPQISVIMGPCAGGAVYSPALTDFIFMVEGTSQMFITGPGVIKAVTGEEVSMEDLGGAGVHASRSGVADFTYPDDKSCIAGVQRLLSFLPPNNLEDPPVTGPLPPEKVNLDSLVPDDPRKSYDMKKAIAGVVDGGDMMEVKAGFARNMVVGFARINGQPVGVVANQPLVAAGSIDVDASDKAARFIRFCDAFNLPLVIFVDVPGFLPGTQQEYLGIIRHGAKILYAWSEATVPKLTVILRKSYGGAYLSMCSKDLGADFVWAWPTAEIAVMGPEGAVDVVFRKEITGAEDSGKKREELIDEYREKFANPYDAASKLYIDDVIEPNETRERLSGALELLAGKRENRPMKKHGNMPL